jgi:para-nitrobenzyl esterase
MTYNRRAVLAGASLAMGGLTLGATPARAAADRPLAATTSGKVRGAWNREVAVFKGVPYGASTAGTGRFKPPQPVASWTGIRDALAFGASSPQGQPAASAAAGRPRSSLNDQPISDDCLFLNVWSRGLGDGKRRPVMVWLHGGGFSAGTGSWPSTDGTRLAERGDVVVVTLNHRLSAFGFLYLAELGGAPFADSGNAGMLDIVQALQWVKQNIAAFGGDPGNVTIFGESGGGAKVSVLMGMPAAKGLFHRAIIQSGAHLTGLGRDEATENARLVMKALDLAPGDVGKLQDAPVDALLGAIIAAQRTPGRTPASFSPVTDGRTLPAHPWLDGPPAISATIPVLIGSTRTETTLLVGAADPSTFDLDAATLRTKLASWLKGADMEAVIAAFQKADPKATPSDLFFAITTDLRVRKQSWALADRKASQRAAPVWMYELHFDQSAKMRSPHAMDVPLVFDNPPAGAVPGTVEVAAAMASSWIAFARDGDPNNAAVPRWPAYTAADHTAMLFEPRPRLAHNWRDDERAALAGLPVMRVDR